MRGLADELAAAGKPIQDDELISYLLHGLDMDYQPLVSALGTRVTPVSLDELYAMLSNFDRRVTQFHSTGGGFKSSANAATRGRGEYSSRSRGPPRHKGKQGGGSSSNSVLGNVVISKKFLRTRKIMVMHSNERGECVHVPS